MSPWTRRLVVLAAAVVVLGIALLAASLTAANYLVDLWWFESLGFSLYYWQRLLYRYLVLASVTGVFFLFFFVNFWIASRYLGTTTPPSTPSRRGAWNTYREWLSLFRTGSLWIYTPLSLALAALIAWPLFEQWEAFLLYLSASPMGEVDPAYGRDVSFYLFSLPVYTLVQRRLLLASLVLLCTSGALYWIENKLLVQHRRRIPNGAKWHLYLLTLLLLAVEAWDLALQRYDLLYTDAHMPLFFGPGFVEMRILLPLLWAAAAFLTLAGLSLVLVFRDTRYIKIPALFGALFLVTLAVRHASFVTQTVQKILVKPNELSREKPFIQNNIRATLSAYGLDNVETREFTPETIPTDLAAPVIKKRLRNIPVWDGELLEEVYRQLQQLRTYYNFTSVHVDRYTVDALYQQVFLAARELSVRQLPEAARNWINEHLVYTHGYGAVMTPASQSGDQPITWFLHGIPPESAYGFRLGQPGIYFGLESYNYVVAPNDAGEIDYPSGNSNVTTNYTGKDGVPIGSLFRKLIFAGYFKDRNLFLTTSTNRESKILFRRNIIERIRTLTPFLVLDQAPYLVVTPERLYWIQDAYTLSDWYPCATPYEWGGRRFNYFRNSVKIVVDAYNGSVDFYRFDPRDPILSAYSRVYPGIFKDAATMPRGLSDHVRYPQDLFEIQMSLYAKYQQTDPEVFYQQEDTWEFSKVFDGETPRSIKPYYLTLDLMDSSRFDFLQLVPMSPKGRANLRALAIVGCDPPHYGKIVVYSFPKGQLVFGPSQVDALINQDTRISEQFTLWGQVGSQVDRGRMLILPIGQVILYIQPVYLKSSSQLKIPELKRLIMSQGEMVVMEPSLEEAYAKLQERLKAEREREGRRPPPAALPEASP